MATVKSAHPLITIDFTSKRSIHRISKLDRETYFCVHGPYRGEQPSKEVDDYLMGDLNASPSRAMWHIRDLKPPEDPARPGYPDPRFFDQPRARCDVYQRLLRERPETRVVMSIGFIPPYMEINDLKNKGTPKNYDAYADLLLAVFRNYRRFADGWLPKYLEVKNESDIPQNWCWHWQPDAWNKNAEFHRTVAAAIKREFPSVLVGGPTLAWPKFENRGFKVWNDGMKKFIDLAGAQMDFLATHLYDHVNFDMEAGGLGKDGGSSVGGVRGEAVLDLIDNYSKLVLGKPKPVVISEYGAGIDQTDRQRLTEHEANWLTLKTTNAILMTLLDRPGQIIKSVPFILQAAAWDPTFPYVMYRNTDGKIRETSLVKFYQFWSPLRGDRIVTRCEQAQVLARGFVDGATGFLALHNSGRRSETVSLQAMLQNDTQIKKVAISRLYLDQGTPRLDRDQPLSGGLEALCLAPSETALVKWEFSASPTFNRTINEEVFYGDRTVVPLGPRKETFLINLPGTSAKARYARLRVGLGNETGFATAPKVRFNGKEIKLTLEDAAKNYFGVSQVAISPDLLKEKNEVTLEAPQSGGHISSVALLVGMED